MINFRCRCSHSFSVPDDQAGESLQCPQCGLLVDVPTLEELQAMEAEGTYTLLDLDLPIVDRTDVRNTPSIVSKDHTDRRLSLKEFLAIGTDEEDLLEIKDEIKPGIPKHPKYDPETGELIRPMEIVKPPPAPALTAEPAVLGYQVKKPGTGVPSIWMPYVAMFRLENLLVCVIVTGLWLSVTFMSGIHAIFSLLIFPVFLLTIAHFANVVDETGPTGNDEIPRPLRGVNFYDDFIRPLGQVMFAYALASAPIVLFNLYVRHLSPLANIGLAVLFYTLVPALLLTLITSGALNNLVPHRALSVIGASSWHYWVVAALGYVATAVFGFATVWGASAGYTSLAMVSNGQAVPLGGTIVPGLPHILEVFLAPLAVFGAMYLLHVFAWQMGLMYRLHHERFAWVLQKADKSTRTDTNAQLQRRRQREAEARAREARANLERRLAEIQR